MQEVKAITDDLLQFAIHHTEGASPAIEFASSILVLWDSCKRDSVEEQYEAFRQVLSTRWGVAVTKGTAYFVLEKAAALINTLKKTHTS